MLDEIWMKIKELFSEKVYLMEDVPKRVLEECYKKWNVNEWTDELWQPCAMCSYVGSDGGAGKHCAPCPLYKPRWCTGYGPTSKLSERYSGSDKRPWVERKDEFLKMLKTYMEKDL